MLIGSTDTSACFLSCSQGIHYNNCIWYYLLHNRTKSCIHKHFPLRCISILQRRRIVLSHLCRSFGWIYTYLCKIEYLSLMHYYCDSYNFIHNRQQLHLFLFEILLNFHKTFLVSSYSDKLVHIVHSHGCCDEHDQLHFVLVLIETLSNHFRFDLCELMHMVCLHLDNIQISIPGSHLIVQLCLIADFLLRL